MHSLQPNASGELRQAVQRRGSMAQTFKAVAWSFFGVRKARDNEVDFSEINPMHVLVAGVLSAALFVCSLVIVVAVVVHAAAQ